MKYVLIMLLFLTSCYSSKEDKKIAIEPKYSDSVYLKPDSSLGYIHFFGIIKSDVDTTFFYGIEKDSCGYIRRSIIYERDIFGKK